MLQPSNKGIDYALDKLCTFVKINRDGSTEEKIAALDNFAAAVGLDALKYEHLTQKMTKVVDSPGGELGWAVIGTIVGLYIAEHAHEH